MNTQKSVGLFAITAFILLAFLYISGVSQVEASPLLTEPTPTPSWHSRESGTSTATHDGNIGITSGNTVTVSADSETEAIVIKAQKVCPGGSNSHWSKGRWDMGTGWSTFYNIQTCGETQWKWYHTNNVYSSAVVDDEVWALFPALDGDPNSGVWGLNDQDTDYQAYTEAGTGGDAGYQSVLQIWEVKFGPDDCVEVDLDEREFVATGLLDGDDEVGESIELDPGQEYVLITGGGPWNDGTDDRYDVAIRFRTSYTEDPPDGSWGAWEEVVIDLENPVCDDSFLDANGVYYIFEAEENEPGTQAEIQIRVNDTDGNFDDNTGDMEFYFLAGDMGSGAGCEDQWVVGSQVAGRMVLSSGSGAYDLTTAVSGGTYDGRIISGAGYMYRVVGTYTNNGLPENDTYVIAGENGSNQTPNQVFTGAGGYCVNEVDGSGFDATLSYYGITDNSWDSGIGHISGLTPYGAFPDSGNNSGAVALEWYEANWTAPVSDCGSRYDIGTYIESPVIFANDETGKQFPVTTVGFIEGQVYYLESQGTPYYLDGSPSWDFEVGDSRYLAGAGAVIWEEPEDFFDCITPIDGNRYGYYWTATGENIYLRAEHNLAEDYTDNTGSIKFNIYGAIPNDVPAGESCSDYYSMDRVAWRGEVSATSTTGYPVDSSVFTAGEKYAIKITSTYTDPGGTGKTGEIRRSVHGAGSVDFDDMDDWEPTLCYEQDGSGYDIVYFEATEGADYEVRATTPGDNTGTIEFEVWEQEQIKPTVLGCEYAYSDVDFWYVVKQDDRVDANNQGSEVDGSGNVVAVPGHVLATSLGEDDLIYRIETGFLLGSNELLAPKYDLQISGDGGATWVYLEDWVDCWVDLGTPEGRGFFTTPVDDPGPYILRVYDIDGSYYDNIGGVNVSMWVSSNTADPGDVWTDLADNPYSDRAWGSGCYSICVRPGILEVGEWVEYARCRLTRWLAWCPHHSEEMDRMRDSFAEVEPFRTIAEMLDLTALIREEIDSYSWNDDGGGSGEDVAEIAPPPNFVLLPGDSGGAGIETGTLTGENSIWGSGEIDLTPTGGYVFRTECTTELSSLLGTRIAPALCFGFNVLDQLGLRLWFQTLWDILALIALVMYIKRAWIDKMM